MLFSSIRNSLVPLLLVLANTTRALESDQILLVYNHYDADSLAIREHYRRSHPGIHDFDLASQALPGYHTVPFPVFRETIRNPIRRFLLGRTGMAEKIVCIVLTKGIPHRIQDMDKPLIGDEPGEMRREWLERGDFTAASVDSELTLLWQDLERNEAAGAFDSKADGFIVNPYFGLVEPITDFSRRWITHPKRFIDIVQVGEESAPIQAGWEAVTPRLESARLTPGDLYLVARLDGKTREDVIGGIDRARNLAIRKAEVVVLLDADSRARLDKYDYIRTERVLQLAGWNVMYDTTGEFLTGDEIHQPVIAYASYGRNDSDADAPETPNYIGSFRFSAGAIFNTLESFNGRDFGGAGNRPSREQTQLSAFLAAGGTFGIGNVWEPFSFSASMNEFLLDGFLNRGLTFIEAAYSSLRVLSWQQIVVGDPLGRIVPEGTPLDAAAAGR